MFDDFFEEEEFEDAGDSDSATVAAPSLPPANANPDLLAHTEHEKILLKLFNEKKLPHALIFAGPSGIGKTTAAFRLARFLLKHGKDDNQDSLFGDVAPAPTSMDVPQSDPVFSLVASGGHPDLRFFERPMNSTGTAKKTVLDVDTVRKIAPFLRMSSSEGGWRVVIVDEADMMNRQAQNAILKILEEPPPRAMLILICNRLGAMIPTIRSRCRTFHFAPLDAATLENLLKRAAPDITTGEMKLLTALSDGSMGKALTLHEEKGGNTLATLLEFLSGFPDWDWAKLHPYADNLSRTEGAYESFTHIMEWVVQNLTRAKAIGHAALPEILAGNELQALENQYSLGQWIEICEKLGAHFTAINNSNLDKRQGVIGAFGILGGQGA
ncbi:MAG: DNA polymerase III subunit delta' [Micavibrio aeruginosavorus]|uniref:DNA polymerase III subunit delta n=1 Tax=Micavibrio aeruginosavorus TaxID=349221 RepID=A0A2W5PL01_9BACT|nr:MAG: DNA polymerase III subunit delta' [Micavibrio aeruginosavorus]